MAVRRLQFATCLAPNVRPMYAAVADYVSRRLGIETELVDCEEYERYFDALEDDVHFVCSVPYIVLSERDDPPVEVLAAPVLEGERCGGRPVYFSDVIVRRDAPFESFADLRGASWAYNEPFSHSGYGVTRYRLVEMGETDGFFGRVVEARFHEQSIEMVRRGEIDASAIDCQVLAVAMRDDPTLERDLRIIDSLGPSTIQPVTVARRLPQDLRRDLRSALLEMGDDPEGRRGLALGLVQRFVPVEDADYDDIRRMLAACESAGFTVLR